MKEPRFDYIVVINHEYAKPIKWKGLIEQELNEKKKKVKEEGLHLQVMAVIKTKK